MKDGKLTIDQGGKDSNTKINYVHIVSVPTTLPYSVKLQMYNSNRSGKSNSLSQKYKLYNTGTTPINLKDVKIRYYYTSDSDSPQNFWCDWSNVGNSNITGKFETIDPAYVGASSYLEIGFTENTGTLAPEQSVEIYARQAKDDWSDYIQSDDYSFNSSSSNYVDWEKAAVYVEGDYNAPTCQDNFLAFLS